MIAVESPTFLPVELEHGEGLVPAPGQRQRDQHVNPRRRRPALGAPTPL